MGGRGAASGRRGSGGAVDLRRGSPQRAASEIDFWKEMYLKELGRPGGGAVI